MVEMIQVLFPHMNTYDRQALLNDIRTLEPEKFKIVLDTIQPTLDEKGRVIAL